ncbi:hypothetical protein SAMN05444365_10552 [Micromonospora pattaloongensis]|uniref:Uncharacterized protein n=1 Tax=Micromonospora pattaloongensis TaxID=405436 RepID=A0A1H3PVU6_9ACTN|nr:hypothetical protein [Micromonospora pattaloongensis]SDZ05051.1 hypothetical protein SAMN05444365_10552 [Micromonospora pattaloongensis]
MHRAITKKTMLGGLAAAGVLAVGIAAPAVAMADPTPSSSASTSGKSDLREHRAEKRDKLAEALATELGVPKEKVQAALDKIQDERQAAGKSAREDGEKFRTERKADRQAQLKERLDDAVAQGKLSREQADAITKAFEAGVLPGIGKGHHGVRPDAGSTDQGK